MNKEELKKMLEEREQLQKTLETQYAQLVGQIALLKELLEKLEKEETNK